MSVQWQRRHAVESLAFVAKGLYTIDNKKTIQINSINFYMWDAIFFFFVTPSISY